MEKLTLAAQSRDVAVKLSEIRASKKIPSVVYGHKIAAQSITVEYSEFLKTFRKAGKTHLVELSLGGKKQDVLIHEVQKHPVTGDFLHIDFFVVSATEKIHVEIPLVLIGVAPAQREGGMVEQNMHTLEVKCFAKDLVDSFEVDISVLAEMGDIIHVQDLGISKKFDILAPLDAAVVAVHAPKGEVIEDEPVVAAADIPAAQDEKKEEAE